MELYKGEDIDIKLLKHLDLIRLLWVKLLCYS